MSSGSLGREYRAGEEIIREGEVGACMYVVQEGEVDVLLMRDGTSVHLATLGPGEFFGEMAIFERSARSATVRAKGRALVLTVDKKNLLRRVADDPTIAMRIIEKLSHRVRELDRELASLKEGARG